MLNLATVLESASDSYPDRTAIVFGDTRMNFADVHSAASRVAHLLTNLDIHKGDRVALSIPNTPWFPIVYYGILKAGAVVVPLNILLRGREVGYHLRDSGAKVYVAFDGSAELPIAEAARAGFDDAPDCRHLFTIPADSSATAPGQSLASAISSLPGFFESVDTNADDTAVILYTSGTTGQPKGAELTHGNMVLNAVTAHRILEGGEGTDTQLIALPMFHSFAQSLQLNAGFVGAATAVLLPRFDPIATLRLFEKEKITHFAGVPTMYQALVATARGGDINVAAAVQHLKVALSGGAALPLEVSRGVEETLGVRVREGYGLSETSPAAAFTPHNAENRHGSIGKPIWGVRMKLVDEKNGLDLEDSPGAIGEIAIKGHPVMKGYLGRPEATAEVMKDGWLRTGDLARKDDDGYYFIVDRAKDLIIRGGFNVYPREIEEVLLTHPAIAQAAVLGVPHATHGEEVMAVVVLHDGHTLETDQLIAWGRENFAAYKYPRIIEVRGELPLTSTGKILKRLLRESRSGRSPQSPMEDSPDVAAS